jgi:hypothetical protein
MTTNTPVVVAARKSLDQTEGNILQGTRVDEGRLCVLKLNVLGKCIVEIYIIEMYSQHV